MIMMFSLCSKRFVDALIVLFCLITLTFFLVRFVPGGPFDHEHVLAKETEEALAKFYGYDLPLSKQYANYCMHLLQGDFGPSMRYPGYSVNQLLKEHIPVSIELGFWAILMAVTIGGTCGLMAAAFHNSWVDRFLMSSCLLGLSLPTFVLGPILLWVFALKLEWFQAVGWDHWSDRVLPTLTLTCMYTGYIARLMRTACLDTLAQDFIRTARAKGVGPIRLLACHVLKNALGPVLTYLGPAAAAIMSGSLVIESLFQIPGAGSLFISAIGQRDVALLLGTVLYFAVLILLFNLLVDVCLFFCNPKQRANK